MVISRSQTRVPPCQHHHRHALMEKWEEGKKSAGTLQGHVFGLSTKPRISTERKEHRRSEEIHLLYSNQYTMQTVDGE